MLHKINRSIRVPEGKQMILKRKIIRLTLNPGLFSRTESLVHWSRESFGTLAPVDVVLRARHLYPSLSWSDSVELYLVDLLEQEASSRCVLSEEEEKIFQRFESLPLLEKIRFMQKKLSDFRYLQRLTK
jgi:hypothetical protein